MEKINLLIPMNGLGSRFSDENYYLPKPLINVLGKPMIFWLLDNLNLDNVDTILVAYTALLDNFSLQEQLTNRYKTVKFKFSSFNYVTRGAAETVCTALDNSDADYLDRNIMILDCDTFYFEDIINSYTGNSCKNNILYFNDTHDDPIYSYIVLDDNKNVVHIAEKDRISQNANCGVYCFESGHILKQYCQKLIASNQVQKNEFYISGVYKLMINDKIQIGSTLVKNFQCVGTPMQLKIFCEQHTNVAAQRFCFDLDNTLVTCPTVKGDYTTCQPIHKTIEFLRYLKNQGHYIIIHTARRMRTHNGNVNAVIKDIGLITLEQLQNFDIPYDEIQFGKPWADFYIDDLAVNCNLSLEKQIGYYNTNIKSRNFNQVKLLDDKVVKSGNINGERYYYKQIQQYSTLIDLFPSLLDETADSITIERVRGITFNYLYTNNCLSELQFTVLLEALYKLHQHKSQVELQFTQKNKEKILMRYKNYDYTKFTDSKFTLDSIMSFLERYLQTETTVIHGDPVFTNVLIDNENNIKLIDMRGSVGDSFTIHGDPIYDISKVYQSLVGYDYILNNQPIKNNINLIKLLDEWITTRYSFCIADVQKYTASLYFSLIPLHDDEKCEQYYQMAYKLINQ